MNFKFYVCILLGPVFSFPRLAELLFDHLILMSDDGDDDVYVCDTCKDIFLTSKEFKQHEEEEHSGKEEQVEPIKIKRSRNSSSHDDVYSSDIDLDIFPTGKKSKQHEEEKQSGREEQEKSNKAKRSWSSSIDTSKKLTLHEEEMHFAKEEKEEPVQVKRSRNSSSSSEGASSDIDPWNQLSDEVVLNILRLLPRKDLVRSSLISRRFKDLSRDESLWTELTLDFENIKRDTESCRKLVDRCKKLSSLEITDKRKQFGLQRHPDSKDIMTVVSRAKKTLMSLKIDDFIQEWTPSAMAKLGRLENLKSLTLTFSTEPKEVNSQVKGANMLEELKNLNHLEELKLSITITFTTEYYYNFNYPQKSKSRPVLKRVFQQLDKLKKVEMRLPLGDYSNRLVAVIAENNPELQVLRFEEHHSISDETLNILEECCPDLREFANGSIIINL